MTPTTPTMIPTTTSTMINGIDVAALQETMKAIKADPSSGMAAFRACTVWKNGFYSETEIDGWMLGGENRPHSFTIRIDEPRELCGQDSQANPQEYLMAAVNACMLNTFVAVCSMLGVTLEHVAFRTEGELDLRGFLGLDKNVKPGYEEMKYTIIVKGDGTEEQYRKAHEAMMATSPNYYNMASAIQLKSELIVR